MPSLQQTTVGELGRYGRRYAPYLALVVGITLVVGLAPGQAPPTTDALDGFSSGLEQGAVGAPLDGGGALLDDGTGTGTGLDPAAGGTVDGTTTAVAGGATGGGTASTSGSGGATGSTGSTSTGTGGAAPAAGSGGGATGAASAPAAVGAASPRNCDPKTGRVRMPSFTAPNCVAGFDGRNGGATAKGVTATTIKVAVYLGKPDPAADAIAKAAGSDDSPEQVRKQYQEWLDLYQANVETYGRKVQLIFVDASAVATDDAAARADALKVAQLGVFASLGAPNTTYINELAARGILCIQCAIDAPAEYYAEKAPFVYAYGMSSTWQSIHGLETIKKQSAGRKAVHAGDPTFQQRTRTYGLIAYDTAKGDYKKAHDFFVAKMKQQGTPLTVDTVYNGYPDTAKSQQQARPIIQKLKQAGVTTVLFSGDPFAPIFFTQEATRQQYFPEWSGSGPLVDTAFFARLYDQAQWRNAFSQSSSTARLPEEKTDSNLLLDWWYGRGPTAEGTFALIRIPVNMLMNGIHYAGEDLTARTYAAGQFNQPVRPGGKTFAAFNFTNKLWPLPDYTGVDDKTSIWWDPQARGKDETGNEGVGLYRYVDGGKRYLPGQHPTGESKLFDPAGTVTFYDDYPAGERPPSYPSPKR